MRILRWRLKLAEYNYDVVYKARKTNVNADTLSRNAVNFEEMDCKAITDRKILNSNEAKDAKIISKMLEEPDEEEEIEEDEKSSSYIFQTTSKQKIYYLTTICLRIIRIQYPLHKKN
ncbi:hypothetical protein P5V15_014071 [Pogonomyrmex californicus]